MRSMFSAVSGLRSHQTAMDVVGNNIANVNTVGFKSSTVTFSDIYSQTIQTASGPTANSGGTNPLQIGLGTNVAAINTVMTQGAAEITNNPLDLMIQGDGFFVVQNGDGYAFTKAGSFTLDAAGTLVTPQGLSVMGWGVDENGDVIPGDVQPIEILSPKNYYSAPEVTTDSNLQGNINMNDSQLVEDGIVRSVTFYDSLGYKYTVDMTIKQDPDDKLGYTMVAGEVKDEEGNVIGDLSDDPANTIDFNFDSEGNMLTDPAELVLNGLNDLILTEIGSQAADVKVDFSDITMFNEETSIQSYRGDVDGNGAGRESGVMTGFGVGVDGKVYGQYTNGDMRVLGQVVVAEFSNPAGLESIGNNLFAATANSGEFNGIGVDPTSSGGGLSSGALEMSNVDLSQEFTNMIIYQRGFQANSRIITTSDELLQELVNLKR